MENIEEAEANCTKERKARFEAEAQIKSLKQTVADRDETIEEKEEEMKSQKDNMEEWRLQLKNSEYEIRQRDVEIEGMKRNRPRG